MRREDLFLAIGEVEEERLVRCEKHRSPSVATHKEDTAMRKPVRKIWLIAAIVTLMVLLMGSAITALVKVRVTDMQKIWQEDNLTQVNTPDLNKHSEDEIIPDYKDYGGVIVNFDSVQDAFVELDAYYPHRIPEGYATTFVCSDAPINGLCIRYENGNGGLIEFRTYGSSHASSIELYWIEQQLEITVNGESGILYEQKDGNRTLVWINDAIGIGFTLQGNDPTVDLLTMAESISQGEPLVPTWAPLTEKALEELRNYSPKYLPEGFEELWVEGSPLSEGSNWYSYVHKWYVNKADNTEFAFTYSTYRIATEDGYTDDARTACSFCIPGYYILSGETAGVETEINGMFGIADKQDIAWADPEKHIVYHLHSEDITGEELLKIAKSITPQE